MRHLEMMLAVAVMGTSGCSSRTSSLLLERPARGPIVEIPTIAHRAVWHLSPETQMQTQRDLEVNVTHATPAYLNKFFSNRAVFGQYAGKNPYYPVHLVFYIQLTNQGEKKVLMNPTEFVLVDDRGNQYHTLGQDYITAFAESRRPASQMTHDLLEGASPGYFGVSVPVGKMFAQKPMGDFALLLQSALKPGPLFPGAVYDGLIAFWSPASSAKTLRLLLTNIKTDFDANEVPKTSLEFVFEFQTVTP